MLETDGGWFSSDGKRQTFSEYLPILIWKGFSLKLKGSIYSTSEELLKIVSETWPMKLKLKVTTKMSMIGWFTLKEKEWCGDWNQSVSWLGSVDCAGLDVWNMKVKLIRSNIQWRRWNDNKEDIKSFDLSREDAQVRNKWRKKVKGQLDNQLSAENVFDYT